MNSLKQPVTKPEAPASSIDPKKFGDPRKGKGVSGSDITLHIFGRGLHEDELKLGLSHHSFEVMATV